MKWLLRNALGLLMLVLCASLTLMVILVRVEVQIAPLLLLGVAGVCLLLAGVSRIVPLDLGSYAPSLRDHTLMAYRVWRSAQGLLGRLKDEQERLSFEMVDWLFENVAATSMLYRDMSEEEEHFWCAYLRYRTDGDDLAVTHNRALRRLYKFLELRRTTEEGRARLLRLEVLRRPTTSP